MVGGVTNPERGRSLLRNRSRGGGVEGGGGDSQLMLHRLHNLPRLPLWVPGGLRYGDHHPQGKSDPEGYGHEGVGTSHDISGPTQGVRRLGNFQVPEYPRGICHGAQGTPPSPQVLGETPYGGAGMGGTTENPSSGIEA